MSTSKQDDYYSGMDIKSLGINIASILLFVLPIACYLFRAFCREFCIVVGLSFVVAYCLPPMGWKRPHPYSDNPNNLPWPRKAD